MTSIGRFSLKSETPSNLSNITFFLALAGPKKNNPESDPSGLAEGGQGLGGGDKGGMTVPEFESAWLDRAMPTRHPRFHSRVSRHDDRYFELETVGGDPKAEVHRHASETLHTYRYRDDLRGRIERLLTEPLDVMDKLWEVHISSGRLGSSGAISRLKADNLRRESEDETESLLLFRAHHSLADGVSLIAALADLSDEAEEVRASVRAEMARRKKRGQDVTLLQRLATYLRRLVWFCLGSIRALLYQGYLLMITPRNPFEEALGLPSAAMAAQIPGRSVSWCDVAPLDEIKAVAHAIGKAVTLNDVFVSCVTRAVGRQLAEHRARARVRSSPSDGEPEEKEIDRRRSRINVVVPVHLDGGFLSPGSSVGNRIGALVARCPGEMGGDDDGGVPASQRLRLVHDSLAWAKGSPAPLLSWVMAKLSSDYLPEGLTKRIFRSANANAAVVVSNARGTTKKQHINGRAIESSAGFLPLPPGIPVGVVVTSYAGTVSLTLTAERWAVPDGDRFMGWVLEEYRRLCAEVSAKAKVA